VIQHFKNPMDGAPVNTENAISLCESEFERQVYLALAERGWRVRPQVKVGDYRIDLVVEGAEDRRLAVELDGDKYHGPDRWLDDYRRQLALERLGWRFWRCWGSSWTLSPGSCLAELEALLRSLGIVPLGAEARSATFTEHRTVGGFDEDGRKTNEESVNELDIAAIAGAASGAIHRLSESGAKIETHRPIETQPNLPGTLAQFSPHAEESLGATSEEAASSSYFYDDERIVESGDRVVIEYNDSPGNLKTLLLTDAKNDDPEMGVIFIGRPIAQALLGQPEEEVVDMPAGDSFREATIRRIEKKAVLSK
jgi:very-short-patch-repair endonuclease